MKIDSDGHSEMIARRSARDINKTHDYNECKNAGTEQSYIIEINI
jgi:ribosomal protein S14